MKKVNIPAIHDKDLLNILTNYGLDEKFRKSELNCFNCNEIVTQENLSGMIVDDGTLLFVCDNPDCLAHATSKNEENNI